MPDHEIAGVTALVTGASRGFGRAIAAALTGDGPSVIPSPAGARAGGSAARCLRSRRTGAWSRSATVS